MNDVRIPQELAMKVVRQHSVGLAHPAEQWVIPELVDAIRPQLQPGYRIGDIWRRENGDIWLRQGGRADSAAWSDVRACSVRSDEEMRNDYKIRRVNPTGLNVCDLVEHLKKGPVVRLNMLDAMNFADGTDPTAAREATKAALADWRENQKP